MRPGGDMDYLCNSRACFFDINYRMRDLLKHNKILTRWLPVLALLLVIFLLAGAFVKDDECVITWSPQRKLNWSDYRGKPKPRFAAASTVYSLGRNIYEEDGKVLARIEAYFYCNDSWKKEAWISDEVLAHEQKHFDIVELYARKLRKQAAELSCRNLGDAETKIDSLYKIVSKEMDVYQDTYDDATDGSMDGDQQRKWIRKIDAELKALEAYATNPIVVKTSGRKH